MRGRIALLSLLALGIAIVALAGSDLNGTWVLDKAKSDPIRMGGRQGADAGGPPPDINITLTIKQSASDIAITRITTFNGTERPPSEQKFTLDGKESKNPAGMGRGELVAKAKWESNKLSIDGTQKMSGPNGDFEMAVKQQYALSEDGKVLTVTNTTSTPQGERTQKQVFNLK